MATINSILGEINDCIKLLMKEGICYSQNFAYRTDNEILPKGGIPCFIKAHSPSEYKAILSDIRRNEQYEIELFDGSFISMSYSFTDDSTIKEMRFIYLPSMEYYELRSFFEEDEVLNLYDSSLPFFFMPIRVDYHNTSDGSDDPYCHMHIGFINESRLPMNVSIMPKSILSFILEYFYPSRFLSISDKRFFECSEDAFFPAIRDKDRKKIHLKMDPSH